MNAKREEILAHMADVARAAEDDGRDGMQAILQAFPGTPTGVAAQAWCMASEQKEEEWWQSIEKTIDAEAVKSAARLVSTGAA